jgi:chromodomain-helicase-DNA-binding protein 4
MEVCGEIFWLTLSLFDRVTVEDLERGMKTFPGLRMKLTHFHKMLDASKNWNTPDEDRLAIRPEWTTVDRVLDMRFDADSLVCLMSFSRLVIFKSLLDYLEDDQFFLNSSVKQFRKLH